MKRLKTFLFITLITLALPSVVFAQNETQKVMDINLNYKDGLVTLVSLDKREGYVSKASNTKVGYKAVILDASGSQLTAVTFNFPLVITSEGSANLERTEADYIVTVADNKNAEKLQIIDPEGRIVLERELNTPLISEPGKDKRGLPVYAVAAIALSALVVISIITLLIIKNRRTTDPSSTKKSTINS